MPINYNGITLTDIIYNGTSLDKVIYNGITVFEKITGTLTLKEIIYNTSGTFTVPSNAVNNEFYIGCTGGGGGGAYEIGRDDDGFYGGGGSGRTSGVFILIPGNSVAVTVGSGGIKNQNSSGHNGGTSSFGALLSCLGGYGYGWKNGNFGAGVSGGGSATFSVATASNCPAILSLKSGAIDNTTKLYLAKSYAGGTSPIGESGGGGCYGPGATSTPPAANSGAGGHCYSIGGSGKIVIYYYVME